MASPMRPIIPTTLAELPKLEELSSGLGARHDYYIKEIDTLEKWKSADLGSARVWCPLNSFNIPSGHCTPGSWLCLQGAGDLLMLRSFLALRKARTVTTYSKLASILDGVPVRVEGIDLGNPSDLDMQRLGRGHEYTIHHPLAMRPMLIKAISTGWDHFDWMGLMLGLKGARRWMRSFECSGLDRDRAYTAMSHIPGTYKIGLHLTASTQERSALDLLEPLARMAQGEDYHFLLLGGSEPRTFGTLPPNVSYLAGTLSYHETAAVLQLCHAVIAVDSIVLHLANAATDDVPILGLYTWSPATWAGYRNDHCDTMEANGVDNINIMEVYLWMKRKLETRIR